MILKVLFTDGSLCEYDLDEYMYKGGEHCLTITKNIGWDKFDYDKCEVEVIPYTNIYKYYVLKKHIAESEDKEWQIIKTRIT